MIIDLVVLVFRSLKSNINLAVLVLGLDLSLGLNYFISNILWLLEFNAGIDSLFVYNNIFWTGLGLN